MKKCVSCAKDLPDAALHCVFCGSKQAPVAPAAGGAGGNQAKTVMGWQASDVLAGLQGKPTMVPGAHQAPPPAAPPGGPPPQPAGGPPPQPLGHAATLAVSPAPAAQPLGTAATMMATPAALGISVPQAAPPPAAPPPAGPPQGAAAKTMFVNPGAGAPPPAAMPPPGAMPPPAAPPPSGASTMMATPEQLGIKIPQAGPPPGAPPPGGLPPSPASGASTMFQPSPFAGGANPMGGPMGGPPPGMGGPMGGPPPGMGGPMGGPPPGMGGPMGGPPGMGGPPMGGPPPGMGMGGPPMGGPPMGGPMPGMGGPPMGGPMPGMGGPPMGGPMPGMGGPPMGGPMPGMGGPPMGGPGMGGYPQPGMGGPPMGGPPMGGYPQPGQPYGAPPYLASRSAARAGAPFEPYNDALKLCLVIFGVLLLAAFAVPTHTDPMAFRWDALKGGGDALGKFHNIYFAAAGVLALVFGVVPLATVPRGALAAVLGVVALVVDLVILLKAVPKVQWQFLVAFGGSLTLVAGLLLRHEYRSAQLGRILATIGALCIIVVLVVPQSGGDPQIKGIIKVITDAPGKAKIGGILKLLPFLLAIASLLVWLPAPSSAGAKVIAWLFILLPVISAYTMLLVNGHIGDAVKANPNEALLGGWVGAAWAALIGYGLATVFGKNLEQQG